MGISLSPETQKLIEQRMLRDGYSSADEVVRAALESLDQKQWDEVVVVDPDTQGVLDRADAEIQRGEYRDLKDVAAELRAKYPRR